MNDTHPMLPTANHDETAEQLFIRDLKGYIGAQLDLAAQKSMQQLDPGYGHNARAEETYR